MRFDILTIFPKIFSAKGGSASGGDSSSYFDYSILKRAQKNKLITIKTHNLRQFTTDKHHKVDDTPYGGGPGMVFMVEPIYKAVKKLKKNKARVILFSTRGKKFDAKVAKQLLKYKQLILICGRYEGVDERVAKHIADEEISIGDFVLSGGELPAMILVEAVSRFVPGVLGKRESLEEIKGFYPVYTKPEKFNNWKVPNVLLLGNHKKIEIWRKRRA